MAVALAPVSQSPHRCFEVSLCQPLIKHFCASVTFQHDGNSIGGPVQFGSVRAKPFSRVKMNHYLFCKTTCTLKNEGNILQASSMEEIYNALASRLLSALTMIKPGCKYIVGLSGPPGAGKTTVANEVVNRLNALWHSKRLNDDCYVGADLHDIAIYVPMDGFHLYRWQLDAMEDPTEAHARRGAPWTFDPVSFIKCLSTLRNQGSVYVPSFDHGVGDPIENDIFVNSLHKVVLVDGNYLLLTEGDWKDLASIFDERWFLEIDIDKAMERVEKRHILTGKAPELAKWRVEYNDRKNAELIAKSKKNADLVIYSVDSTAA